MNHFWIPIGGKLKVKNTPEGIMTEIEKKVTAKNLTTPLQKYWVE
jgi:hypothetical protein